MSTALMEERPIVLRVHPASQRVGRLTMDAAPCQQGFADSFSEQVLKRLTMDTGGRFTECPLTDIYTAPQILALWRHCCNGNGDGNFVTGCNFTGKDGEAVYYYRDKRVPLERRLRAAYRTAAGKTSNPNQHISVCTYAHNLETGLTVIGAGDFDAHERPNEPASETDWERAAAYAWEMLVQSLHLDAPFNLPPGFLRRILEHTGGGYRLTLLTKDYIARETMAEMLRHIADRTREALADSPHPLVIAPARCELFPDWREDMSNESLQKPTKLPGSFNTKRGVQQITLWQDLESLVAQEFTKAQQSKDAAKHSPEIKKQYVSLPTNTGAYGHTEGVMADYSQTSLEKMKAALLEKYPAALGTRNEASVKLVAVAFERMSEAQVIELAGRQYAQASGCKATMKRHMRDAQGMIETCRRRWMRKLTDAEEIKYRELKTDAERDCFRILRDWWKTAQYKGQTLARFSSASMAARIGVHRTTVDAMRKRFHEEGVIADARIGDRHCFRWMPWMDGPTTTDEDIPSENCPF